MKKFAFLILALSLPAFSQNVRWDNQATTTTGAGQLVPVLALPGAFVNFYTGCTSLPCLTPATTFISEASSIPCPTNAQVVWQTPSGTGCKSTADSQGSFGGWFAFGSYQYTVTVSGHVDGPYSFNIGGGGGGAGNPAPPILSPQIADATGSVFASQPNVVVSPTGGFSDFAGAITAAANGTLVLSAAQTITTNTTIPSNVSLEIRQGGSITVNNGVTLSINGPVNVGRYVVFYGPGVVSFVANSFLREIYPEWWGADPTGNTDSTAAWQAAANAAQNVNSFGGVISCPAAVYNISNTITSFGPDTAKGVSLLGPEGQINNASGSCSLKWTGVAGGTIWHYLGGHLAKIQNINFNANSLAGRGLWLDTAQSSVASTTGSLSRSSNIVTATLVGAETWPSGTNVFVSGASDNSFNGMFPVWYQTDSTHISWSQAGTNGSATGATVQTKSGGDTSGLVLNHNHFYEAPSAGVGFTGSISSNTLSVTLASPQIVYPNQWVWITGSSDPVYNAYWHVLTVTSSTTFTAQSVEVVSEGSTSSGTFFPSTTGLGIGSNALSGLNLSVCCLDMHGNLFEGTGAAGGPYPLFGVEVDAQSNTKNFFSTQNGYGFLRIGWINPRSGVFISDGDSGTNVIDALFATSVIGSVVIKDGEWESTVQGYDSPYVLASMTSGSYNAAVQGVAGQFELFNNTSNSGTVEIANNDFEMENFAPDGVAVATSATTQIINNNFGEAGNTNQVPIINVNVGPNATTTRSSLYSSGNTYYNVVPNTTAPLQINGIPILNFGPDALHLVTSLYDKTAYGSLGNQASAPLQSIENVNQINAPELSGTNLDISQNMRSALFSTGPYRNYVTHSLFDTGATAWPEGGSGSVVFTTNANTDIFGNSTALEVNLANGSFGSTQTQTTGLTMLTGHVYQFSLYAQGASGGEVLTIGLAADVNCEPSGGTFPAAIHLTTSRVLYSGQCTPSTNETAVPFFSLNVDPSVHKIIYVSQAQVCEVGVDCAAQVITTTAALSGSGTVLNGVPFSVGATVSSINSTPGPFTFSFSAGAGSCSGTTCTFTGAGSGGGSVTNFIANNLAPLFTTSVATSTVTPTLSFALTNAAQNTMFAGPASGGSGAPTYRSIVASDVPTLNQSTSGNAATATALASAPLLCPGGQVAQGVLANGNATGCVPSGTAGTVTNFTATPWPSFLATSVTNSTTIPNLSVALATQAANTFFAGPSSGGAVAPTFRALTLTDIPASITRTICSGTLALNTTPLAAGGKFNNTTPCTNAVVGDNVLVDFQGTDPDGKAGYDPSLGPVITLFKKISASGTLDVEQINSSTNPGTGTLGPITVVFRVTR